MDELAARYGVTREQVQHVVSSQFGLVQETIYNADLTSEHLPTIGLQYLGKFNAMPGKLKRTLARRTLNGTLKNGRGRPDRDTSVAADDSGV